MEDIPNLRGKVMIVTGGNSGIGRETVKALLACGAKVYMATRNNIRANKSIQSLKEETGKEAIFLQIDLADLSSVKVAAEEFLRKERQLHALFNNAGLMAPPIDELTKQGVDLQFGANVLGHFYFTKLLLSTLLYTSGTSPGGKARVVNTSSLGHMFHPILFDALKEGPTRQKLGPQNLYFQSKHGNVVFASELARRYGNQGIVSTALNPGNINTNLLKGDSIFKTIIEFLTYPASMGAVTQLWAGTSPEAADFNGKYLIPWARIGTAHSEALDIETGTKLWEWMEEQVRIFECEELGF